MYVPGWFSIGLAIVLLGGLLFMIGNLVELVGVASLGVSSSLDTLKAYEEGSLALVGIGGFLVVLGWVFHQAAVHRRSTG